MAEPQLPTANTVLVDSVLVEPFRTIDEEEPFPTLPPANPEADDEHRRKGRPRLMRGLSRMSSFPNLNQFGRRRASSTPYDRSGAAMSCSSLAPSSGSAFPPLTSPIASRSDEKSSPLSMSASLSAPFTRNDSNVYSSNSDGTIVRKVASASLPPVRPKRSFAALWATLPREVKIHIFAYFKLRELVRLSRVSRDFHATCFDGQLWTSLDATEFYRKIPASSLAKIATTAGPFIRDLNLRGCVQIHRHEESLTLSGACQNLVSACLEGSHINPQSLHTLLQQNTMLVNINLSGLESVDAKTCLTIASNCQQLEVLDLSWCKKLIVRDLNPIINSCTKLRDLRVRELRSFDTNPSDFAVAHTLFETNRLERLIVSGSMWITNAVLTALMRGPTPDTERWTNDVGVPPRRLRHIDFGQCCRLTPAGLASMGQCVPDLEGLVLSGCGLVTDAGLIPILASCPKLTHLELEDLTQLTDTLLVDHLAKAPCVASLKHLSLSYCENVSAVMPVLRACKSLRTLEVDNTQVTDSFLVEAAAYLSARSPRAPRHAVRPCSSLYLTVFDCPNISWEGIQTVLRRNAEKYMVQDGGDASRPAVAMYRSEIVTLKCFYDYQMTVDEHTKRVQRRDFDAADRLEYKWVEYMRASDDANEPGIGARRRRRRAREAGQVHADEAHGAAPHVSRRRARTASCAVM